MLKYGNAFDDLAQNWSRYMIDAKIDSKNNVIRLSLIRRVVFIPALQQVWSFDKGI